MALQYDKGCATPSIDSVVRLKHLALIGDRTYTSCVRAAPNTVSVHRLETPVKRLLEDMRERSLFFRRASGRTRWLMIPE